MSKFVGEVSVREWDQEVAGSEVPVLVDFWADWCAPCHKLSPIVEKIAEERADQMKVLKLDIEANPEIAMEHEIRSAPTLVLFSGGVERGRVVGFLPKPRLDDELEKALALACAVSPGDGATPGEGGAGRVR
jgi:thioredoxin 1